MAAASSATTSPIVALLGPTLVRSDGSTVDTDKAMAGKDSVGIYFSAHCEQLRGHPGTARARNGLARAAQCARPAKIGGQERAGAAGRKRASPAPMGLSGDGRSWSHDGVQSSAASIRS